jgi:hypothetical protein
VAACGEYRHFNSIIQIELKHKNDERAEEKNENLRSHVIHEDLIVITVIATMTPPAEDYEDYEDDDVPLHHQRPFGSGLKLKAVRFVSASSGNLDSTSESTASSKGTSVGDRYLSIVLGKDASAPATGSSATSKPELSVQLCKVCNLPLDPKEPTHKSNGPIPESHRKHEASIAHQVCLTHSYPPSSIDRSRKGLAVLESYGWDPDSRRGLGYSQQGIQHPIKAKPKDDTLGIGVNVPKQFRDGYGKVERKKVQKLDAKQCRKLAEDEKKKIEKLRRLMFGNDSLEKYGLN